MRVLELRIVAPGIRGEFMTRVRAREGATSTVDRELRQSPIRGRAPTFYFPLHHAVGDTQHE